MANMLDCGLEVCKVEFQSCYNVHFQIITLKKVWTPYPVSNGLNGITAVLLQGWFWNGIAHEVWYAIKQRNQTKHQIYIHIYKKHKRPSTCSVSTNLIWWSLLWNSEFLINNLLYFLFFNIIIIPLLLSLLDLLWPGVIVPVMCYIIKEWFFILIFFR